MKYKQALLAILFSACCLTGWAARVESTAGNLSGRVANPSTETRLAVVGTMDASDFEFITKTMTELTTLDLSQAEIVAYDGSAVLLNRTSFPANTLPAYGLAGLVKLSSVVLPAGVTAIGDGALSATGIASIEIPLTVTSIGDGAFAGCRQLASILVPYSVTKAGTDIFSRCTGLTSATWAGCSVPASTFVGCTALETMTLAGTGIASIGAKAFQGCTSLREITLPVQLLRIGEGAFENTGLGSIDMSEATGLHTLGPWAFANCRNLESVRMSPATANLGEGLFFNDPSLSTLTIPSAVTTLPDYIFKGDTSLDVAGLLDKNITVIGDFAFKGLAQVEEFLLPAALQEIGTEAMAGWTSLRVLHAETLDFVPELGDDVWEGVDKPTVRLIVPERLIDTFRGADQWREFNLEEYSGETAIEIDRVDPPTINAWFDGTVLHIATVGALTIDDVVVFNVGGSLMLQAEPKVPSIEIDTDRWSQRLYLIGVTLSNGTTARIKIAR